MRQHKSHFLVGLLEIDSSRSFSRHRSWMCTFRTTGWDSAARDGEDWVAATLGTGKDRDPCVTGSRCNQVPGVLGKSIHGGSWAWIGESSDGIRRAVMALSSGREVSVLGTFSTVSSSLAVVSK